MTHTASRATRLYVRADAHEKSRIELAAQLSRQNVSEFVRQAVEDRAEQVLGERLVTILDTEAFDAIAAALDEPITPNAALRRAARKPRRFVHK